MEYKENQSPLRPILKNSLSRRHDNPTPYAVPLQESNDVTNRASEINFSRKRTPSNSVEQSSIGQAQSPRSSKRNKSNKHKRSKTMQDEQLYASARMDAEHIRKPILKRSSSDLRASRFQEATMRDSPSAKPPSLFLRVLPKITHQSSRSSMRHDPAGEHLIDAYLEEQQNHITKAVAAPLMQTARSATRATQLSGLTHHANTSISSSANSTATGSESSRSIQRDSGLFKFGKSVKEAWQNFKSKSSKEQTKDTVNTAEHTQTTEMMQRRLKAEKEFAALKSTNKATHVTSRMRSNTQTSTIATSVADVGSSESQRDSGIDMSVESSQSFDARPSFDMRRMNQGAPGPTISQRISSVPGKDRNRFHFRTPSFQDLKRIASQSSLHRRATSTIVMPQNSKNVLVTSTASVEVDERPSTSAGFSAYVKSARSRKDLLKEEKLAKRVNELEEKLTMARKELEKTRSMELLGPMKPADPFEDEPRPTSRARPESRHQNKQLKFQPLPTLQSESLLIAGPDDASQLSFITTPVDELPLSKATGSVIEVETPKRQSESRQSFGTPGTEPQPSSAFDSSSESSPEGILNAFRRHKAASSKSDGSPSPRKSPRRIALTRTSRGSIDRSTISAPILADSVMALEIVRRASLDTVSEEASIISSMRARFSPSQQASSSPQPMSSPHDTSARSYRPRHRHTRSLSPVKNDFSLLRSLPGMTPSPNQFQHLRARSMSPLPSPPAATHSQSTSAGKGGSDSVTSNSQNASSHAASSLVMFGPAAPTTAAAAAINFSRPVTPAAQSMRAAPIPRLAPSRDDWQWPEDVF